MISKQECDTHGVDGKHMGKRRDEALEILQSEAVSARKVEGGPIPLQEREGAELGGVIAQSGAVECEGVEGVEVVRGQEKRRCFDERDVCEESLHKLPMLAMGQVVHKIPQGMASLVLTLTT